MLALALLVAAAEEPYAVVVRDSSSIRQVPDSLVALHRVTLPQVTGTLGDHTVTLYIFQPYRQPGFSQLHRSERLVRAQVTMTGSRYQYQAVELHEQ
jgi:hypothetical protein